MLKQNEMQRDPNNPTSFLTIYDAFFSRITDDMYMELTEEDTYTMLQDLLINNLPRFEFPRFDIFDYEPGAWGYIGDYQGVESNGALVTAYGWIGGNFNIELTLEEINIIALNMVVGWLGQQLDTTENTRMKYSGSDFKFTSQANHMAKLKVLVDSHKTDSLHLQRLYKRRIRTESGEIQSTLGSIVTKPAYGFKI
jgi:hypothetical protein